MNIRAIAPLAAAAIAATIYFAGGAVVSAEPATKEEAVAMVQKAVAAIKSEGPEKAYAEISNLRDRSSKATSTSRWSVLTARCSPTAPTTANASATT